MKNITPKPPIPARLRSQLAGAGVVLFVLVLCLLFPRMMAFVELAARELRYLWWLILLGALGIYFFFFFGRKKE